MAGNFGSASGLRQTSVNVAATLVSAMASIGDIKDRDDALSFFDTVSEKVFAQLQEAAKSDPAPVQRSFPPKGAPAKKTSGIDEKEPIGDSVVTFGKKYPGRTLDQVLADGDQGRGFLEWVAKNSKEADTVRIVNRFLALNPAENVTADYM